MCFGNPSERKVKLVVTTREGGMFTRGSNRDSLIAFLSSIQDRIDYVGFGQISSYTIDGTRFEFSQITLYIPESRLGRAKHMAKQFGLNSFTDDTSVVINTHKW